MAHARIGSKVRAWMWSWRRDKCVFCKGSKGGMLGNENVYDDQRVCDYCSVILDKIMMWDDEIEPHCQPRQFNPGMKEDK